MSARGRESPLRLGYPFRESWRVQNSPANRVPSHGTSLFALDRSIDLVPVDGRGRTAPFRLRSLLRPEPPQAFPGFGRKILSPAGGVVEVVHGGQADHRAHRGVPSIRYALAQGRRVAAGWRAVAGNHVILRVRQGHEPVYVALCHLRQGSIEVRPGQEVTAGQLLARCGNSGNSTEPHLHLQAMTAPDPSAARPVAFTFPGGLPRSGTVVDAP